jgi:anthranilate synthase/aminodeoxychorismate synthase-like glutamine amidotransferase
VKHLKGIIPILGVCLGHQVIGQQFGAKVIRASTIMHGKTSTIHHEGKSLFKNIPHNFKATRYHSLVLDNRNLGNKMTKTAWCFDGGKEVVMAIEVKSLNLFGVQFHPESVTSEYGEFLLLNFLKRSV